MTKQQKREANKKATQAEALAALLAKKAEIDALLARIAAASDDHFGSNPESLTWADAETLGYVTTRLTEITEYLGA